MRSKRRPNDPCPCGSGRKVKKCCGSERAGAAASSPPYTPAERSSAFSKLRSFIDDMLHEEEADAHEEFWGRHLERQAELPEELLATSRAVEETWFLFDAPIDDSMRPVDDFLALAAVTPRERAYLQAMAQSTMRLYEVTDTVPGSSMTLRDLVEGTIVVVNERTASRSIARHEWIAARVVQRGCSGGPEMERGVLHVPRLTRDGVLAAVQEERRDFLRENPGAPMAASHAVMPPLFHDTWLESIFEPTVPRLTTADGEDLVITRTSFHVDDAEALTRALDGSERESLRREADATWCWWSGDDPQGGAALAGIELLDGLLVIETQSVERGVRARALVERIAGTAIRHRGTTHEDVARTVAEQLTARALGRDAAATQAAPAMLDRDTAEVLTMQYYSRHYRAWLDEPVPALDLLTPRQAAGQAGMQSRVEGLLHDLEGLYERALKDGEPAFDPSWMWAELGLRTEANPPSPPALAHERVARRVPGCAEASRAAAERARRLPAFSDAATTLDDEELGLDLGLQRFLRRESATSDGPADEARIAAPYIPLMVNLDLHRRKIFWVDASLAYMLEATDVDIDGGELRVPFPSFALVLTDRHALSLGERLLSQSEGDPLRGQILRVATAYVTERHRARGRALEIVFAFDALGADLPSLVRHEVPAHDGASIAAFLEAVAPRPVIDGTPHDASPARALLRLVINAILYATSAGVTPEVRPPAPQRPPERPARAAPTSDSVYFLPGKIDIRSVRQLQELERAPNGRGLFARFIVRGHWRRAAKHWTDPRLRWIEPYWKGPDLAAVIEKAYSLKP